jgi:OOP family OmpA-OmpF porin
MKHDRNISAGWTACGLGLLLAGCSTWSYSPPITGNPITEGGNLAAVREAAPQTPSDFNQALTADYAGLATKLDQDQHDWNDADYFSRKGLAASAGSRVPPEDNVNWLVPMQVPVRTRTELSEGRQRLVADLDGGARDTTPAVAAQAQVSYDCWVRAMEFDWHAAQDGDCRKQFLASLDQLENRHAETVTQPQAAAVTQPTAGAATPPDAPREYRIYFNFNSTELLTQAEALVAEVADRAKGDVTTHIVMVGKADLAGSDTYNEVLSHRRADAVRDALLKQGVPENQVEESWVGDRQPPVPTPGGAREPRNRVVEIDLK